jgi:YARHG domain-containing protein
MPASPAILVFLLTAAPGAAAPPRPLYYDHWLERGDLRDRTLEDLRLMRNTIYARAGREFKDPDLRAYFGTQPWYHPTATPAKLSAVDERNLLNITKWEPTAKAMADLRSLVPGWGANAGVPPSADCVADAKDVLADRKRQSRLIALARRLDWSGVEGYDEEVGLPIWAPKGRRKREVGLGCTPDLDGDGAPEAILQIRSEDKQQLTGIYNVGVLLLLSRKGRDWRAVAPLGVDSVIPGIEGSRETNVQAVKLASGKLALAVATESGGGGDCDSTIEKVSVFSLKEGKLIPVASFDTSEPLCLNEY